MEPVDTSDVRARFRARLIRRRLEANESQHSLAAKAGITPSMMTRIEKGSRDPSLTTVIALAEAVGTSVDDLMPATLDADDREALARDALTKTAGARPRVKPLFPATVTRTLGMDRRCVYPFAPCNCTTATLFVGETLVAD